MATSKNSKKGSKPVQMLKEKKVKPKKKERLIELTKETYLKLKDSKDLSGYTDTDGKNYKVVCLKQFYGKTYIVLDNE